MIDTQDGLKQQQRKYLNICVVGQNSTTADPATGTLCQYDANYPTAILDRPCEWVLGIDRFNIPMLRVPRMIDPAVSSNPAILTIIATETDNSATTTFTQTVTISGVLTPDPFNTGYIYLASQWVQALQAAFNTITGSITSTLSLVMVPPLVTYNAATGVVTLQTHAGAFSGTNGIPNTTGKNYLFTMYFNQALWRYFPTLPLTFFNWSNSAAPTNTANFYALVNFAGASLGSPTPTNPVTTKYNLPAIGPGPVLSAFTNGTLTTALTAGNNYTQLALSVATGFYMGAGQSIVLSDSASGTKQTVFIAEGNCPNGSTTVNTLLFTANFSFPSATTTILIYNLTVMPLGNTPPTAPIGAAYAKGTLFKLTGGGTTFTLSRSCGAGDQLLYCEPYIPYGEPAGTLINPPTTAYDAITAESPIPPIWTNISSVRVRSTKLPICPEFSPDIVSSAGTTTSQAPTNAMVTDFVIDTTSSLQTADSVQFVTENPRWVDLIGDMPIYNVDLKVYWVDFAGIEHPVYIPTGYRFDMKLNFKRKYTKCLPGF